jgi:predicted lipid-binding transport protein (Tim44 family)
MAAAIMALIGGGLYVLLFVALFGGVILLGGIALLIFLLGSPNVKAGEVYGPQRREVLREEEEEEKRETGEAD